MKNIFLSIIVCLFMGIFSSCSEEKLGESTINVNPPQRNDFDNWLLDNYIKDYNINFKYRMDYTETDMKYNLLPADLTKSIQLAKIVKYLWIESYNEVFDKAGTNKDFIKRYAPKVIQLVGSAAINPESETETLGTAEGGVKVTLYKVNSLDPTNIAQMNEYYFKTMHHEFTHILHQTKDFPIEFRTISGGDYTPTGWQNKKDQEAWTLGFVTPYASCEPQEDFAEIVSVYLTKSNADWNTMISKAGTPDPAKPGSYLDKKGADKILQKLTIAKSWMQASWGINIDELRTIIARRSTEINTILK